MMKKILHMIFMVLQIPDPKFNYYQVHDATNPREKLELEIYKAELKERKQEFIDYFLLSELQKHSRAGRFTI